MIYQSKILNETTEILTHRSGLTVILCQKPGAVSNYAGFCAKYGSIDTRFKLSEDDGYTDIVDGVAHFLEHKLFESEQGDALTLFAKTGVNANAGTSFDKTNYYFTATRNFYEALRILLDFVTHPYFSEQTIAKEQGIIGQEIKMYDDLPGWRVYFNFLGALYHNSAVKIDIGGSIESISKITPALLNKIYSAFYSLRNMALVVSGDFEREKVLSLCDECLVFAPEIEIVSDEKPEPPEIVRDFVNQQLEVVMPLFQCGYKMRKPSANEEPIYFAAGEALCELAVGEGSTLYRELYDTGLINSNFGGGLDGSRGHCCLIFGGESPAPETVAEKIKTAFAGLFQGISDEDFERVKSKLCGRILNQYNTPIGAGRIANEAFFSGVDPFAHAEAYFNLQKSDLESLLSKEVDYSRFALSTVTGFERS
ncbi:MAG TPA: pitrilysin family protein [Oscillospiraceae bacterium]|nr:pitrilysin family protein [Oscillospiraceae bacterium]HPF56276.1 pitrilysin family protein [Clostridiales bacterium]HPK35394.1 pitrilysin family protein [Oscillospiraceae bacterium]HPR75313.1 pitrilysin family protein [Oscillospiraceae bacterium]